MRRIAALVPNVLGFSPGQRVRIELWAEHLKPLGWTVDFYPFEDKALHEVLYESNGHHAGKALGMLRCYGQQMKRILRRPPCDVLFIYREAALIGPAVIERLAKRLGVPIVYDIDDPVFVPYRSPINSWFSLLKFPGKTHSLFRMSDHIISINSLMGDYAAQYNPHVTVVPNCVDTDVYCPSAEWPNHGAENEVRIVWMGSKSTMPNLQSIAEPLRRLQTAHPTPLRVIGVGEPDVPGVQVEMIQWAADREVPELQQCHIGLVPLPDLPWNKWKFFLKVVQYMGVGLPVIARRMGSNSEVIQDGVNGFLVETPDEWHDRMKLLVEDHELRRRMSRAARETAVEHYATRVQMPRLAKVFDEVADQYRAAQHRK
jgi:glycosyltransferase involved in cell wall biosynthesis